MDGGKRSGNGGREALCCGGRSGGGHLGGKGVGVGVKEGVWESDEVSEVKTFWCVQRGCNAKAVA